MVADALAVTAVAAVRGVLIAHLCLWCGVAGGERSVFELYSAEEKTNLQTHDLRTFSRMQVSDAIIKTSCEEKLFPCNASPF